jgi:IS4 transposase
MREHTYHPRLVSKGAWDEPVRADTGALQEQAIGIEQAQQPWRRIRLVLDQPTQAGGEREVKLWSNLQASVSAGQIAQLQRKRWRIEGMFQRHRVNAAQRDHQPGPSARSPAGLCRGAAGLQRTLSH